MKLLEALQAFPGSYEIHLTVAIATAGELERFEAFGTTHDAKALIIELSEGATPTQPMLTLRLKGEPAGVAARINGLASALCEADFDLLRLKVEASIHNANIPHSDSQAQGLPGYFEHHLRLQLPAHLPLKPLASALKAYGGHLSANALHAPADGPQERYVTQRVYQRGLDAATEQLEKLLKFCRAEDLPVTRRIQEYIIYDTRLELDAGWMEA